MRRFDTVLWDLDGTLCETRRDIATAVNLVLAERGLSELSVGTVTRFVGMGSRVLMTRCLERCGAPAADGGDLERAYQRFLIHYREHLLDVSAAYPGIPELLEHVAGAGISMGIVTNKPERLSRQLVEGLRLSEKIGVILGGDSLPERKPHPAPLLRAIELLGAAPETTVMVGDSTIDLEAGQAAGTAVAAVTWGFGSRTSLAALSPDHMAESPRSLGEWLSG